MTKIHTESFVVRGTDCDMYRRMRLDALFIAMQEGGEQHACSLGFGHSAMLARNLFFVLARIHVKIDRPPRCGETVVHTTWPGTSNRFFCPRFHTFTLEDGTPLVTVAALWVILDTAERRIVSPLKVDLGFPDNSDIPEPLSANIRIPALNEVPVESMRTPVFSEFDINGHVNNTKYIAWLADALGSDVMKDAFITELVASYEKEIRRFEPMILQLSRKDDTYSFKVMSAAGEKHFTASGRLCPEASDE